MDVSGSAEWILSVCMYFYEGLHNFWTVFFVTFTFFFDRFDLFWSIFTLSGASAFLGDFGTSKYMAYTG